MKNLSANKDLVIHKSDKGNAVVILNRRDYIDRVKGLLSDTTKFEITILKVGKELRHMVNIRKRYKVVLNDLLNRDKIVQKTFYFLDPIGKKPWILYGLSKVHKTLVNGLPKMRPILSAIGTASYNLSKFLIPMLDNLITGPYVIHNSFHFNKEVLKQDL